MDWKPSKPPPEQRVQLEQKPRSRWQSIKNQVVRATKVVAAPLITVLVISMIWLLWRDVIRVGGNSDYVLRGVPTVVGILILIGIGYRYEWTGFGERAREKSETGETQRGKTLWDWMSLLFVPLMIVGIGIWFTWWQNNSQQGLEARQRAQEAERQAQYSALQAYLDQTSQLMFERDLLGTEEGDPVFTLAQARTTAIIGQSDGEQNQVVTHFLSDAGLLRKPALLAKVDLQDAKLHKAVLQNANLAGTDLRGANLSDAVLIDADFFDEGKKVPGGTLALTAGLSKAALQGGRLIPTNLTGANLSHAALQDANLSSAFLPDADLSNAFLQNANLTYAVLTDTNLTDAHLRDANLTDADLAGANLTGATGVTQETLEMQARDLEGATMPDGSKHP